MAADGPNYVSTPARTTPSTGSRRFKSPVVAVCEVPPTAGRLPGFDPTHLALAEVGEHLVASLPKRRLRSVFVVDQSALVEVSSSLLRPTVEEAVAVTVSHIVHVEGYAVLTQQVACKEIARFGAYLRFHDVTFLADITAEHCTGFIRSAADARRPKEPSPSTQFARRSAIRLLFRVCRIHGLADNDPTIDIKLPSRSASGTRPLTDDEESWCRIFTRHTLFPTAAPAAWALGQASATTNEIAACRVADVDLENGRVWLHGNAKRIDRWGPLTEWGVDQLGRRIGDLAGDRRAMLVTEAKAGGAQVVASRTLRRVLDDAGLHDDPLVTPSSLPAWRGAATFRETRSIEAVATVLGLRSLDDAARAIAHAWDR